jgi:hypothetical protein
MGHIKSYRIFESVFPTELSDNEFSDKFYDEFYQREQFSVEEMNRIKNIVHDVSGDSFDDIKIKSTTKPYFTYTMINKSKDNKREFIMNVFKLSDEWYLINEINKSSMVPTSKYWAIIENKYFIADQFDELDAYLRQRFDYNYLNRSLFR